MASFSNNTTSVGIRAPLTIDESDFECSVSSSKSRRNSIDSSYNSNSELESEGFVSGEDDSETRPYVTGQDEDILEETQFFHDYGFRKPYVVNSNGEIVQKGNISSGNGFSRPFERNLDENIAQESGNVNGNSFSRPSVRIPDENFAQERGNVDVSSFSRAFVRNPGEKFAQESGNVDGSSFSRPSVRNPDENFAQERGNVYGKSFSRAFVRNPGEKFAQESGNVKGISFSRAFVGSPDENFAQESGNVDGNSFLRPSVWNSDEKIAQESSSVDGNSFFRPSVWNSVEKLAQESSDGDRNSFSRAFVTNPDVSFAQQRCNVNGNSFFRPFVGNPDVKSREVINKVDDYDDSRSFLCESDHEFFDNENYVSDNNGSRPLVSVTDEENFKKFRTKNFNIIKIPIGQNFRIPFARISRDCSDDDDDDSQDSEVVEDEGVLDMVRVSSFQVLRRVNSVPKVRISESDEGDDDELRAEKLVQMEFIKDLVTINNVLGTEDESQHIYVEDIIKCVITSDTVEDKAKSLEVDEEYNPMPETGRNIDYFLRLNEEIQEFDPTDDLVTCVDLVDCSNTALDIARLDQEKTDEAENSDELPNLVKNSIFDGDANAMLAGTKSGEDFSQPSDGNILHETNFQAVTNSDCGQLIDPAASFKAVVEVVVSDEGASEPGFVDGVEILPTGQNSADSGSIFGSTRYNIETRTPEEASSEAEKTENLADRLGHFPEDSTVSKVLRQLSLAEEKPSTEAFLLDSVRNTGFELRPRKNDDDVDFSLCIVVIGKTGVGKSATINSIFGENKTTVNAFEPSTARVKEINGEIDGIKIKMFDTPGLRSHPADQKFNRKIMSSITRLIRESPPDVILYVDRLDTECCNRNDLPLLKSITSCLGSSIWRKSIIVFTHANKLPSDIYPLSYEEFIDQRSRAVRQLISQSAGEINSDSIIPVSLIENHHFLNTDATRRSNLLFLCCSMKILSEVSRVVKTDNFMDNLNMFFRYCFLEPSCRILTRSVFDSYCDFDLAALFSVQLRKDSKINVRTGMNKKLSVKISVKTGGLNQVRIAASIAKAAFD